MTSLREGSVLPEKATQGVGEIEQAGWPGFWVVALLAYTEVFPSHCNAQYAYRFWRLTWEKSLSEWVSIWPCFL
jgi:hypothetical protein